MSSPPSGDSLQDLLNTTSQEKRPRVRVPLLSFQQGVDGPAQHAKPTPRGRPCHGSLVKAIQVYTAPITAHAAQTPRRQPSLGIHLADVGSSAAPQHVQRRTWGPAHKAQAGPAELAAARRRPSRAVRAAGMAVQASHEQSKARQVPRANHTAGRVMAPAAAVTAADEAVPPGPMPRALLRPTARRSRALVVEYCRVPAVDESPRRLPAPDYDTAQPAPAQVAPSVLPRLHRIPQAACPAPRRPPAARLPLLPGGLPLVAAPMQGFLSARGPKPAAREQNSALRPHHVATARAGPASNELAVPAATLHVPGRMPIDDERAALPYSDPRPGSPPGNAPGVGPPPALAGGVPAWPITPAQALQLFRHALTDLEQSEILDYPNIYFLGQELRCKLAGSARAMLSNSGYDDERGDYKTVLRDHICFRYEILGMLGHGSFGQVVKCLDHKSGVCLAVKIIRNKPRFHKQAATEVRILQHLRCKDPSSLCNIVHMRQHFRFRNHLCIAFELLCDNLYEVMRAGRFQGLSTRLVRRLAGQLLVGLQFLERERIVHCDLKPENILLVEAGRSRIKIIDFGSSCFDAEQVFTYIQSRFYRAPEVVLGLRYAGSIDIWSLGCVLAELLTGNPLFPSASETELLHLMMEVLGAPPPSLLQRAPRRHLFFDAALCPLAPLDPQDGGAPGACVPGSHLLARILPGADAALLDFLGGCLQWDPLNRATVQELLQHPWLIGQPFTAAT